MRNHSNTAGAATRQTQAMDEKVQDSSVSGPIRNTPCVPDSRRTSAGRRSLVPSHEQTHRSEIASQKKQPSTHVTGLRPLGSFQLGRTRRAWVRTWRFPTLGRTGRLGQQIAKSPSVRPNHRLRHTTMTLPMSMTIPCSVFDNGHFPARFSCFRHNQVERWSTVPRPPADQLRRLRAISVRTGFTTL